MSVWGRSGILFTKGGVGGFPGSARYNRHMKIGERLKSLWKEPLVHFLVAGLIVFLVASWRGGSVDPADRTITIDEAKVNWLAGQFQQTWQRQPNAAEIDTLIRDYVNEEVYYREAMRLGLDQDDLMIRRRLRSKMEFLAASQVESVVPDEATLQKWLGDHPARYAGTARFSFDQVWLGSAADDSVAASTKEALARLKRGERPEAVGKPISLPAKLDDAGKADIARQFGDDFAAAVAKASPGQWIGPVTSGYGLHLVRLRAANVGARPTLADVRQQVENDWRAETLAERQARAYQALLDGYMVKIAKP